MDIRSYGNMLTLMNRIFDHRSETEPLIKTEPQKPEWRACPIEQPFSRKTPEECGIPSGYIAAFLRELKADKSLDMHNIMILKDGAVIAEGSFGDYDHTVWHITHSQCKSIVGLAIGMLMEEGKISLDDKVADIFKKNMSMISQLTYKELTLRHLLTMTSGVNFYEPSAMTHKDWIKGFFSAGFKSDPGKAFSYNSMNTYVLAAIIKELSGQSLMEYLEPRLWKPLGIRNVFWETCPLGIEKAGWGLYICPEDIAKIGQMVLQNGVWNGKRIVFERYIKASTTAQSFPQSESCIYDYGYQMWTGRNASAFLFNGMFGQNVIGFKDTGFLVVSNAGNEEMFQQSSYYTIVEKYFGVKFKPARVLSPSAKGQAALRTALEELRGRAPGKQAGFFSWMKARRERDRQEAVFASFVGKRYLPSKEEETGGVGLLPLIVQAVQNNYAKSISALSFQRRGAGEGINILIEECDGIQILPVSLSGVEYSDLNFNGEPYRVAVAAELATDEDGDDVLKLRLSFLEIANTRYIKLFFKSGGVLMKMSEHPGNKYISDLLKVRGDEIKRPVIEGFYHRVDKEYARYRIAAAMEPEIRFFEEKKN